VSDLTYSVGADITLFERAMNLTQVIAVKNSEKIAEAFQGAAGRMNAAFDLRGMASKIAIGAIAFEALKFSIEATTRAAAAAQKQIEDLVTVGKGARDAGTGTDFFQAWTSHAKELGTEADKLTAILQKAREASTVRLGTEGNASTSAAHDMLDLERRAGNINAGDVRAFDGAGTQEARLRVILDLIDRISAEGKRLAALDIARGFFGPEFETMMRNGQNVTAKMRADLDGMTKTQFPPELINQAEAIQKQLDEAHKTMRDGWLPTHQKILEWQMQELQAETNLKTTLMEIVGLTGNWATALLNVGSAIDDAAKKFANADFFKNVNDWLDEHGLIDHSLVHTLTPEEKQAAIDARNKPQKLPEITVYKGDKSNPLPKTTTTTAARTDEVERYIASLQKANDVLMAETATIGLSVKAKEEATDIAKAEAAARQRGTELTDQERQAVLRLADAMAKLKEEQAAATLADQNKFNLSQLGRTSGEQSIASTLRGAGIEADSEAGQRLADQLRTIQNLTEIKSEGASFVKGLVADLRAGKTAGEALENQLQKIADKLLDKSIDSLISGLFNLGTGGSGGFLSGILSHADGGLIRGAGTGTSDSILSRVSHGEYIVKAAATKEHLPLLEAINSGRLPHFADGGAVGPISVAKGQGVVAAGPTVHISPTINIQGSGGTPEQNADLAKQMSAQVESVARSVVISELRQQMRPGNLLNG
jgi:hypothetical protein